MKFRYSYDTRENEHRTGVCTAKNREAAYRELNRRGIRPTRVEQVSHAFPVRGVFAVVALLAVGAAVAGLFFLHFNSKMVGLPGREDASRSGFPRMQLYGDPMVIASEHRTGWSNVFSSPGESFLARYAQPGWTVRQDVAALRADAAEDLKARLNEPVSAQPTENPIFRQVCGIVTGMKAELRDFVAQGGTIAAYLELLDARQRQEAEIYDRAAREFAQEAKGRTDDALYDAWSRKNGMLRSMGLKMLPVPEGAEW